MGKKVSPLDVIRKMVDDNNSGCQLAPLSNVIAVDQKGARCTMTIGVAPDSVKNWFLGKTGHGGLFLIDREEFAKTEKQLQSIISSVDRSDQTGRWPEDSGYAWFKSRRQ